MYDSYCEDDADDDGAVASPAGGIPPFRIAFPGEVVEAEGRHAERLLHDVDAMDGIIEPLGAVCQRAEMKMQMKRIYSSEGEGRWI